MPMHNVPLNAKSASIHAVVTRADGRVEKLGVISFYHKNPLIHYPVNFWIKLKNFKRNRR